MDTPLSQCHAWPTSDGGRCNLRGVLKFTPPKWAQSMSYHMAVENSSLFSLNIGDSLTNNAWGKGRWEEGARKGGGSTEGTRGGLEGGREGRREGGRKGWGGSEGGRKGGRKGGRMKRREGGSKVMVGREGTWEGEREGESKGRDVGSDDARQAENVSGGREG